MYVFRRCGYRLDEIPPIFDNSEEAAHDEVCGIEQSRCYHQDAVPMLGFGHLKMYLVAKCTTFLLFLQIFLKKCYIFFVFCYF